MTLTVKPPPQRAIVQAVSGERVQIEEFHDVRLPLEAGSLQYRAILKYIKTKARERGRQLPKNTKLAVVQLKAP